jgi:translation elongation factor EF-G
MSFFDSEMVRAELTEIAELQEEVYGNVFTFPQMDPEDQRYHVDLIERLLNKQQILYTRLSLSDDPQAKKMKEEIRKGALAMGLPDNVDVQVMFKNMTQALDMMRKHIDRTSFT